MSGVIGGGPISMSEDRLVWAFKPSHYDAYAVHDQWQDINRRIESILKYEQRKPFRQRYATDEQYKEEYPDNHEQVLTIAFHLIK